MEPAPARQCEFQDMRPTVRTICASTTVSNTPFGWRCEKHHRTEQVRVRTARNRAWIAEIHREDQEIRQPNANAILEARIEDLRADIQHRAAVPRPPPDTLAAFATDKQNVHTKATINLVRKSIEHVLKIPVPDEYQTDTLKTVGEIILNCKLSKQAAAQMTVRYCSDENIYECGPGIYARLLNCVWQFIKHSEHKDDLCHILRSEMEDNINMCAQGNLSRLCNILSGYMECLVVETTAEQLQRRMAEIAASDKSMRIKTTQALRLLKDLTIPSQEWGAWLEPLIG